MSFIPKEDYLEYARELPIEGSGYFSHDGCTSSAKLWVYHSIGGYGAYCNKCGDKGFSRKGIRSAKELQKTKNLTSRSRRVRDVVLPKDYTQDIPEFSLDAKVWLYKGGITNRLIKKYNIGFSKELHRVIIPIYSDSGKLLMWQGRGLLPEQTKYYNEEGCNKGEVVFKSWCGDVDTTCGIIVEDALSVIRVGQFLPAAANLGTSTSLTQSLYLSMFKELYYWYDNDAGGLNGSIKGMRKMSMLTKCSRIRTKLDPKEYSINELEEILNNVTGYHPTTSS